MPRFRRPRHPVHLLRQAAASLLVVAALLLALQEPPDGSGVPAAPPGTPAVVAVRDLPAGTVLQAADLAVRTFPADLVPGGAGRDPGALVAQVLAGPVRAGELLTDVRVVGPGLWALVPEGQVAAPVRLADLAVAGLLRAGDRVDVLATTDAGGTAQVVAPAALVLAAPVVGDDALGAASSGLLVLAVPPDTAGRLAAASATATLTVTVGRPSEAPPSLPP